MLRISLRRRVIIKNSKHRINLKTLVIVLVVLLVIGIASGGNAGSGNTSSSSSDAAGSSTSSASEEPTEVEASNSVQEAQPQVSVDKTNLKAGIDQWQGLIADNYTPETWQAFSSALDEARKVNDDPNATQSQVNTSNSSLVAAHSALKEAFKPENYQSVPFKDVARNPDSYAGQKLTFTGKVLQVVEGTTETDLRIATDGGYDDVIFVGFDPTIMNGTRVLEDDTVTIYGTCIGQYSYQSTFGSKISLPGFFADNVVIQ